MGEGSEATGTRFLLSWVVVFIDEQSGKVLDWSRAFESEFDQHANIGRRIGPAVCQVIPAFWSKPLRHLDTV